MSCNPTPAPVEPDDGFFANPQSNGYVKAVDGYIAVSPTVSAGDLSNLDPVGGLEIEDNVLGIKLDGNSLSLSAAGLKSTAPPGAAGAPGMPGLDAVDGVDGFPGPPGTQGASGSAGAQGPAGVGSPGQDGEDGRDGFPGVRGDVGAAGADGASGPAGTGFPGRDGEDGADGMPGQPGIQGTQGVQGAVGADGRLGPPGQDGADGTDGTPGTPGLAGPQGDVGATGAAGPAGTPGRDGTDGEDGSTGSPGPIGVPGLNGIDGATGSQGQGVPGQDGEDGPIGPPGPIGPAGPAGAIGPAGFGIPGVDGIDGADGYPLPGVQGIPGVQGVTGPAGRGDPGQDGEDGRDGYPIPGVQGLTGPQGVTGPAGMGFSGRDGEDGRDGYPIPGPQGIQGASGSVTGTGTAGKIAKWSAATVLTDSVFVEAAGKVGLGQTPVFDFDIKQANTNPGLNITPVSGANLRATLSFGANAGFTTGWILGQSFGANATGDFYLYDLINARKALGIDASAGAWTFTGQGTLAVPHKFTTGAVGRQELAIEQTLSGATELSSLHLIAGTANAYLQAFSQGFSSVGSAQAGGIRLFADSAAGLYLEANTGPLFLYANGAAAISIATTGVATFAALPVFTVPLTTVGTLTGGATGAGFTVALSTSTITGTLPAAQMPALTGDVTTVAGAVATTIGALKVTNGMLAGSIAASKLVGTDIATVGTLTAGATGAGFTVALSTSTITGTLADARLSANVPLLNVLNTFAVSSNANNRQLFTNATDNTAALVGLGLTAGGTVNSYLDTFSPLFTTTSHAIASSARLLADGAGGLNLVASHASGPLGFWAGSEVLRWGINAAGDWTFGASSHIADSSGTPTFGTCGSSPSFVGNYHNDYAFVFIPGSGHGGSCVVNFGHTFTNAPAIIPSAMLSGSIESVWVISRTTGSVTFGFGSGNQSTVDVLVRGM